MFGGQKIAFIVLISLFTCSTVYGHGPGDAAQFAENLGQWDDHIRFRAAIPGGHMYVEKNCFTYNLYDEASRAALHGTGAPNPELINAHAYRVTFMEADPDTRISTGEKSEYYENFFLGNDPDKWASNVHSYEVLQYDNLYDGVDMDLYSKDGSLKYDLIVHPGSDPSDIALLYEGVELELMTWGNLHVRTSLGDVIERKPYAYQIINGREKEVKCEYVLDGNVLRFEVKKYNDKYPLIIDPVLVFSTFTGSTANNFGCTATYDNAGNMYVGGTVFGGGYPTTLGAYQVTFGAPVTGSTDMGITKFNPGGTTLVYSTYLGGDGSEVPHSIVVNDNNELFIYGTSGAPTYPVTPGCFQPGYNGGPSIAWTVGYGFTNPNGSDIVVSKLSADGTTLMASTYVGGTDNDGLNVDTQLNYNYGDPFRGEIIADAAGNVYIASCTESNDFPVTAGAPQTAYGGSRDGVVFKMNGNLSAMLWSTYVGGMDTDNCFSVQLSSTGDVFTTGGTLSTDLPGISGGAMNPANGGGADGFAIKINPAGTAFMAGTYIGTPAYDQCYFIQLDQADDVYVLGQSTGPFPVVGPVYSNANSGQFVLKMDNNLTTNVFSTVVGTGSGEIDISPTAFLVNNCGHLYIAGWGGTTNVGNGNALQSTTVGLPITTGVGGTAAAYQNTTDGSDFYLMVLDVDASGLIYATYFGGGISAEHVDGGTSRFDKNGIVYQAVCAGCGGNSDFPSTPGAWSPVNNSSCNLGAFKFDLNDIVANISFNVNLGTCEYPIEVTFTNNSTGAVSYFWDYGDMSTSTAFDAPHLYNAPGTYDIMLVAIDSNTCMIADTAFLTITLPEPIVPNVAGTDTVCAGFALQLDATTPGIDTYLWTPGSTLSDPNIADPLAYPMTNTTYTVTVVDTNGCESTADVLAYVYNNITVDAGPDIYLSFENEVQQLFASAPAGSSIQWTPSEGLSCDTCLSPFANPEETTTYYLYVTDIYGCTSVDTVTVYVWPSLYLPNAFTPNADSKNPIFYAYGVGIRHFEMRIYNRWGELLWMTEDLDEGWDGTYNGIQAESEVYVWKIKYATDLFPDEFKTAFGHVTLVR